MNTYIEDKVIIKSGQLDDIHTTSGMSSLQFIPFPVSILHHYLVTKQIFPIGITNEELYLFDTLCSGALHSLLL